jgi:polyribonucleotide nucleotidyltransferase
VSKVSDVVSVGQVLSLTCIGQDVRGNIKLSLKTTLPPSRNKKKLESKGANSLPSQGVIGWAAVESLPSVCADGDRSSSKVDDGTPEEGPAFSTPAVVIRSVDECDSQDVANTPNLQRKVKKPSPRPYKSASERQDVRTVTPKKAPGAPSAKKTKKVKTNDSGSDELGTSASVVPEKCDDAQDMKHPGPVNFRSGSTKLGDVVTAKVYQIRAYGLVLELSDGVHGMHKFQVTYNDQRKQADPFYVVAALSLYFISIDLCH